MKFDLIYVRVSTDEQAGENKSSLDEQEEKGQEFLARLGYDNPKVFREDYSGFSFDRPELDKIKTLMAEDKVRSLTFWRVDRLTRKSGHLDQLRELYFMPHEIEVYSPFDLGKWEWTPSHIHMQNSLVNFSEYWGRMLYQVMRDGQIGMLKKGNTMAYGHAPLGYTEVKEEKSGHASFVIHEDEARIVRRIFSLYVEDSLSLNQICRVLTSEKVPTYSQMRGFTPFKTNGESKWYSTTIRQILSDTVYKGEWHWGKHSGKIDVIVPVDPLVSDDIFNKAQKKLAQNKKEKVGRKSTHEYLLSKRLTCSCGYKMKVSTRGNGRYRYYRCHTVSGALHAVPCSSKTYYRADLIDTIAWNWLKNIVSDKETFKTKLEHYFEDLEKLLQPKKQRLSFLLKKRDETQSKYDRLIDLFLSSNDFSKEMLEPKKQDLESKLREQNEEIEQLQNDIDYASFYPDHQNWRMANAWVAYMDEMQEHFIDNLDNLNFEEKLKRVEKYDVRAELVKEDNGEIYLYLKCKFDETFCSFCIPDGQQSLKNYKGFFLVFSDKLLLNFTTLK